MEANKRSRWRPSVVTVPRQCGPWTLMMRPDFEFWPLCTVLAWVVLIGRQDWAEALFLLYGEVILLLYSRSLKVR